MVLQATSLIWMRGASDTSPPRGIEQASTSLETQRSFTPNPSMPTLRILEDAMEKHGSDGLPTTDLPDTRQIDLKDQI
jgi:hypothetical protein